MEGWISRDDVEMVKKERKTNFEVGAYAYLFIISKGLAILLVI